MKKKHKFRHWLIKKLGGYTLPPAPIVKVEKVIDNPVTLNVKSSISTDMLIKHPEYEQRMISNIRSDLMGKILEMNDGDLIRIKCGENLEYNMTIFEANVRLLPFTKEERFDEMPHM